MNRLHQPAYVDDHMDSAGSIKLFIAGFGVSGQNSHRIGMFSHEHQFGGR